MSRRGRAAPRPATLAAIGASLAALGVPGVTSAHALGRTYQLPVPLWLYLTGSATAVGASFVVAALVARSRPGAARYPTLRFPRLPARVLSGVLAALGLVAWYGAIAVGYLVGDISPLPAVLFWIGFWVALPIVALLIGNPWPSLSPFRTTLGVLEAVGRVFRIDRIDAGLPYPPGVGRWPAVLLLATALWAELILPGAQAAGSVASLMLGYTALTIAGMLVFGRLAWLRHAELFEVLLGWFGRIGPIGRRTANPMVCSGCEERCDSRRCVDCPECAAAAEPAERDAELRPWVVGLTEVDHAGWSDAAFIVLALAGVSFDGLAETAFGGSLLSLYLPPAIGLVGPSELAFTAAGLLSLGSAYVAFIAAFVLAVVVTRAIGRSRLVPIGQSVGVYASTLLPIAGGYMVAHYLTLVIQGASWLPELLANPLATVAPPIDWIPTSLIWYLSVAAIVGGHIAAIVLGHRIALRDAPFRATAAGLPLVALMIGYTIFSLWIIAQQIVVEPGVPPPTAIWPGP
jgi:hypothetical protein